MTSHKPMAALLAAAMLIVFTVTAADAQTASSRPSKPGPRVSQTTQGPAGPERLVPPSVVQQTKEQLNGHFGSLDRPRSTGQVQRAWDAAKPSAAVYETDLCDGCTYKVRLREFAVTLVELPEGETISDIDVGDKANFVAKQRGENRFILKPGKVGIDTTAIVYGKSGRVYPFYIRAEAFNSKNLPDVVVRIKGRVTVPDDPAVDGFTTKGKGESGKLPPMAVPAADAVEGLKNGSPKTKNGDFVASADFDPNALRGWGEYELSGSEELTPETVFRDDQFTYVRFGKKWRTVELPTAYVVVDGIDELVNTRVQGETYIIESTRALITLKSGQSFLCIRFKGEEA
ncbi:MAG: hypothetical protein CMM61_09625 [Rhodospirillaceae bacterium]|nr:hypothetical protein [Rhodospirillaceae bacterium]